MAMELIDGKEESNWKLQHIETDEPHEAYYFKGFLGAY
jgi:hypothetical protein